MNELELLVQCKPESDLSPEESAGIVARVNNELAAGSARSDHGVSLDESSSSSDDHPGRQPDAYVGGSRPGRRSRSSVLVATAACLVVICVAALAFNGARFSREADTAIETAGPVTSASEPPFGGLVMPVVIPLPGTEDSVHLTTQGVDLEPAAEGDVGGAVPAESIWLAKQAEAANLDPSQHRILLMRLWSENRPNTESALLVWVLARTPGSSPLNSLASTSLDYDLDFYDASNGSFVSSVYQGAAVRE